VAKITLSIVSGTYNRLRHLQTMIDSARLALPSGLAYEFVIVDGGSTDGTLDYLRQQPDVFLLEHGELRGAIPAFCDGARAARGDYVVMANDDITFGAFSIAAALAHLEDHPYTGGVAFADNRPTRLKTGNQYGTEIMAARLPDGGQTVVTYAQVGMFRAWLGHDVGWWGDRDPVMGRSPTYGGDNYLSARLWEMGYSIDTVPGVQVTDHIPRDNLRQINIDKQKVIDHSPEGQPYRNRFPEGPLIAVEPSTPNPQRRRLRILYLPIYEAGHPRQRQTKRGLRLALKRYGHVYEIDYMNSGIDLASAVKAWQPDLLIAQMQDATHITPDRLAYLRQMCPHMTVVNWHGDARGLEETGYLDLLKFVDLQLVVNARPMSLYNSLGITAAYWQIGYEKPKGPLSDVPKYDIVYLANAYNESRQELGAFLRGLPYTVGLYGAGWPDADGECLYDFATAKALHLNSKLVIGDTFPGCEGFVSNRFIQTLGDGGGLLLHQHSPGLDDWTPFRDGTHYIAWTDLDDLREKIDYWLAREKGRAAHRGRIRKAGRLVVEKNYTFEALTRQLFVELLPMIERGVEREPA